MNSTQLWASLYMLFFNMPWASEWFFTANKAINFARIFINTMKAKDALPSWKLNVYRTNCLQKHARSSQLNYYRSVIQGQPKPAPDNVLGPKNNNRHSDLPVLMIRGTLDEALTESIFQNYDQYLPMHLSLH